MAKRKSVDSVPKIDLDTLMMIDKLRERGVRKYDDLCRVLNTGHRCEKCAVWDEPFWAHVEWINGMYDRTKN